MNRYVKIIGVFCWLKLKEIAIACLAFCALLAVVVLPASYMADNGELLGAVAYLMIIIVPIVFSDIREWLKDNWRKATGIVDRRD